MNVFFVLALLKLVAGLVPCNVDNCVLCSVSDANTCILCTGHRGLQDGKCHDCAAECIGTTCNGKGECCDDPYCGQCSDKAICTRCGSSTYGGKGEVCASCGNGTGCGNSGCTGTTAGNCCAAGCLICSLEAGNPCILCWNGEHPRAGGTCSSTCTDQIDCVVCNKAGCTICPGGFYLSADNTCLLCYTAVGSSCGAGVGCGITSGTTYACCTNTKKHCSKCDGINSSMCSECELGYRVDADDDCTACSSACGSGACVTVANAEVCCSHNCAKCTSDSVCTVCYGGSDPVNDACPACVVGRHGCKRCDSGGAKCLECSAAYGLDAAGACIACDTSCSTGSRGCKGTTAADCCTEDNCMKCSSAVGTCEVCREGYFLQETDNTCQACDEYCNVGCTGPAKTDCICDAGRGGCKVCDSTNKQCIGCDTANGFALFGEPGKCQLCEKCPTTGCKTPSECCNENNCARCDNAEKKCTMCESGYHMTGSGTSTVECIKCHATCANGCFGIGETDCCVNECEGICSSQTECLGGITTTSSQTESLSGITTTSSHASSIKILPLFALFLLK